MPSEIEQLRLEIQWEEDELISIGLNDGYKSASYRRSLARKKARLAELEQDYEDERADCRD